MGKISSSNFYTVNACEDLFPNPSIHKEIQIYFTQRTIWGGYPYFVIVSKNDTEVFHYLICTSSSQQTPALVPSPHSFAWCQGKFFGFKLLTSLWNINFQRASGRQYKVVFLLLALDVCLSVCLNR